MVTGASPSSDTVLQSNMVSPEMRLAARRGSTADATHMIEEPSITSKVTASGRRSGWKTLAV